MPLRFDSISDDRIGGDKSVVYEAADTRQSTSLRALKMLREEWATSPDHVDSIRRETIVQARLCAPNPTIFDCGQADGCWYFVAQLAPGITLDEIMQTRLGHPLPTEAALWIAADVCAILMLAHARGVVHDHVDPRNVLVTLENVVDDERAYLLDFGECHLVDEHRFAREDQDEEMPEPLLMRRAPHLKSPMYPFPPGLAAHTSSYARDLFALAALVFELLTGTDPTRTSRTQVARSLLDRPIPSSVATYVLTAVNTPLRGPASASDMFYDLMGFLRDIRPPSHFSGTPGRAAVSAHHTMFRRPRIDWRLSNAST
jgi:serine/threonine protein kinase